MCDVFALMTLAYTLLYFLINVLPDIRKRKEEQEPKTILGDTPIKVFEEVSKHLSAKLSLQGGSTDGN